MGELLRDRIPETPAYLGDLGVVLRGDGKWRGGECWLHGGSNSFRVNTATGGWCCMSCGAKGGDALALHMQITGLDFVAAARDLGAYRDDEREHRGPVKARTLAARDALELLYQDSLLVWIAACNVAQGVVLTDADRRDLSAAARRIGLVSQEARP